MFRIRVRNTVFETSGEGTSTRGSSGADAGTGTGGTGTGADGADTTPKLSVQEVYNNPKTGGSLNVKIDDANTIQFDKRTGFKVTDTEGGTAFVEISSSIDIMSQNEETLQIATNDKLEFIAGQGIDIDTTNENDGLASKAITISTIGIGIYVIDGRDGSIDIPLFEDMIVNPNKYRGNVVYLTGVGPTPRPDPFLWADKFYFNEGGEWFESPFAIGRMLNEL